MFLKDTLKKIYLIVNKNLFPDRHFISEFAMDVTNYVYSQAILMVPGDLL